MSAQVSLQGTAPRARMGNSGDSEAGQEGFQVGQWRVCLGALGGPSLAVLLPSCVGGPRDKMARAGRDQMVVRSQMPG